jgi:adenine-specific DNA-methyltransferase
VYPDDYQDNIKNYLMRTGQINSDGRVNTTNKETSGRFHTDWLDMIYPRLILARGLLSEDGVILVSIDDNEEQNVKQILDDVFGEENYIASFIWKKEGRMMQSLCPSS